MRNRAELEATKKSFAMRNAETLPLTPEITQRAMSIMENLALSHGLGIGDALIAGTALIHGVPLLTGNVKHFTAIDGLQIERFDATAGVAPP